MSRRCGGAVGVIVAQVLAHGALALDLSGQPIQGGLVIGRAVPGAKVLLDGTSIRVAADGTFLIGFGRDAAAESFLVVEREGRRETRTLAVAQRTYDVQRIDGLPPKQVIPDPKTLRRIGEETALIRTVRGQDSAGPLFRSGFAWPVYGVVSGVFGSQRILNGEPRRPHNGLDIAAPEGTPVEAAADGIVALVHEDMFFTGKTVMLDHGHGLTSVYVHMSAIDVAEGGSVRRGQPIGRVGATGRATGPHLHWGVTLFGTHLDPALLVPPLPPVPEK